MMFNNKIEKVENYDIDLCGVAYFPYDKITMDMTPNIEVFQKESDLRQFVQLLTIREEKPLKVYTFKVVILRFIMVNGNLHEVENSYIQFDRPYFGQDRYAIRLSREEGLITRNKIQYNCYRDFDCKIRKVLDSMKAKYNNVGCKNRVVELKIDPFLFIQKEGVKARNCIIYFNESVLEYFRNSEYYKVIESSKESPIINVCGRYSDDGISVLATLVFVESGKYLITGIACDKIKFTSITDKPKGIYSISWKAKK